MLLLPDIQLQAKIISFDLCRFAISAIAIIILQIEFNTSVADARYRSSYTLFDLCRVT